MNATGEWHGKVQFSHSIVKALALVPISVNPVIITYVDGKITIGSTTATCIWVSSSQGMIDKISNPSMIDIFAMWQTQPADQLLTKGIKQSNKLAKDKLLKTTASVAKKLEAFEVTQDDLLNLIESKVKARILKHTK